MLNKTSALHFMSQQSSWAYTCFRARRLLKFVSSTETIETASSSWPRCIHLLTGRWDSDTLPIQNVHTFLTDKLMPQFIVLTHLCGNYNCVHKHGLNEISACNSNMSLQYLPPQLLYRQSPSPNPNPITLWYYSQIMWCGTLNSTSIMTQWDPATHARQALTSPIFPSMQYNSPISQSPLPHHMFSCPQLLLISQSQFSMN